MTARSIYRFLCDGPACDRTGIGETLLAIPGGWRRPWSADHIEPYVSSPYPTRQRRTGRLSYSDCCIGSFSLHLCPDHVGAFDAHLPRTDGRPGGRGKDATVTVSCGCGATFGYTMAGTAIGRRGSPASNAENLWWRHLPAILQTYVHRDAS